MPKIAGAPLTKITLNLFDADVRVLKARYGYGWSEKVRDHVHKLAHQNWNTHQAEPATVEDLTDD